MFCPQEQEHNAHQSKSVPQRVFQVDLSGVRWANVLIALLDDPDVSSGTACEMGIFYELARHDQPRKASWVSSPMTVHVGATSAALAKHQLFHPGLCSKNRQGLSLD